MGNFTLKWFGILTTILITIILCWHFLLEESILLNEQTILLKQQLHTEQGIAYHYVTSSMQMHIFITQVDISQWPWLRRPELWVIIPTTQWSLASSPVQNCQPMVFFGHDERTYDENYTTYYIMWKIYSYKNLYIFHPL